MIFFIGMDGRGRGGARIREAAAAGALGVRAGELVRSLAVQVLPEYPSEALSEVAAEISALHRGRPTAGSEAAASEAGEAAARVAAMHRGRRCAVAYLARRLDVVEGVRGDEGPVLRPELARLLSDRERAHFARFSSLVGDHFEALGLDLGAFTRVPPRELFVEVRVREDLGTLLTAAGEPVVMRRDTTHFLRREDAEPLLRAGKLDHVTVHHSSAPPP